MLKNLSQWKGNAGWFQARRSHLVHEGLELMIVVLVDEKNFVFRTIERPCQPEAGKSGAENDDPLPVISSCCHSFRIFSICKVTADFITFTTPFSSF